MRVANDGSERVLTVELPFADRDELEVGRRRDELLVRVGPHRRAIVLPDSLKRRQVKAAALQGEWLEIRFARTDSDGGAP